MTSLRIAIISLNSFNHLIFVMVKCSVFFEVRTGFLNTIQTCSGFKGLISYCQLNKLSRKGKTN
jgi:hypothetical protein